MAKSKPDRALDVRGLYCPVPILKARKEMDQLEPGRILEIISDDPAAEEDLQRWATRMGYQILERRKKGCEFIFIIKK